MGDERPGDGDLEALRMKMEAMTWTAKAKDAEVAAMQAQLREGRERERRLEAELARVKSRLERVEIAEERLAIDMAELEAEALESALAHKRQVGLLTAHLHEKNKLLAAAADQVKLFSILEGHDHHNNLQPNTNAMKDALHASLLERASKSLQVPQKTPISDNKPQPTTFKLSWWPWSQSRSPLQHEQRSTHIVKLPKHLIAPSAAARRKDLCTPLTASS